MKPLPATPLRRPALLAAVLCLGLLVTPGSVPAARAQSAHELTIDGTTFLLNGAPFDYTGVSFFNALYNPAFNESAAARRHWLERFKRYGINVLRVWGQWDNRRGFVDTCAECTLYHPDGSLRQEPLQRLQALAGEADRLGMVVQFVLYQRESWDEGIRLAPEAADRATAAVARALLPHRNVTLQIWNEHDDRVLDHLATIKAVDPRRLVSNSPGYAGVLGSGRENEALDFLTPHTTRHGTGPHWEVAPHEIGLLLQKYRKPVVDDEPARNGTRSFGGPTGETSPVDHILHLYNVWRVGGYASYHHDMFQTGYGTPAVPPSGIPDPEFSPYHRQVFEFLARRDRYNPVPGR